MKKIILLSLISINLYSFNSLSLAIKAFSLSTNNSFIYKINNEVFPSIISFIEYNIELKQIEKENCSFIERYKNEYVMNCINENELINQNIIHLH